MRYIGARVKLSDRINFSAFNTYNNRSDTLGLRASLTPSEAKNFFASKASGNKLDISNLKLNTRNATFLFDYLKEHPKIKRLIAKGARIPHTELYKLKDIPLETINFDRCKCDCGHCDNDYLVKMVDSISQMKSLVVLALTPAESTRFHQAIYCNSNTTLEMIKKLVAMNALSNLKLSRWDLNAECFEELSKGRLTTLSLKSVPISHYGLKMLASSATLTTLEFSTKGISGSGKSGLGYLAENSRLTKLVATVNLSKRYRPIYESVIKKFANNKTLTHLNLSGHKIFEPQLLLQNFTLTTLVLKRVRLKTTVYPLIRKVSPVIQKDLSKLGITNREKQKAEAIFWLSRYDSPINGALVIAQLIGDYINDSKIAIPEKSFSTTYIATSLPNIDLSKPNTVSLTPSSAFVSELPSDSQTLRDIFEKSSAEYHEVKQNVSYLRLQSPLKSYQLMLLIDHIQKDFPTAKLEEQEDGHLIKLTHVSHDELVDIVASQHSMKMENRTRFSI